MEDISIVIPLLNEEESIPELFEWIKKVLAEASLTFEVIFIDDGSTDASWQIIEKMSSQNPEIRGIKFQRNYGKSAALNEGFAMSDGEVVITMDADLQDSPEEIPELRNMILNEKYDLVSGWKQKRYDPLTKTIPTKLFNWATRKMSGISLHDFNCGLKAYHHRVIKTVEIYGEMHRYIPVIAKRAGFRRIGEKVVQHRERKYGITKFGIDRFINGFLDLLTISFISKFGKRPMHFFGLFGTMFFVLGFLISLWMGIDKLFIDTQGRLITERPQFFITLTLMIMGVMLFLSGFIGELISRNSPYKNSYGVSKRIEGEGK